jgi:hypothetical protein
MAPGHYLHLGTFKRSRSEIVSLWGCFAILAGV